MTTITETAKKQFIQYGIDRVRYGRLCKTPGYPQLKMLAAAGLVKLGLCRSIEDVTELGMEFLAPHLKQHFSNK